MQVTYILEVLRTLYNLGGTPHVRVNVDISLETIYTFHVGMKIMNLEG